MAGSMNSGCKLIDADTAIISLMALRNGKWEPNFPGSDRIEMRRRRG